MPAYKDEKHNTWYVKFRYVDWSGNVHYTTKRGFDGKRKAEKYERDFKDKMTGTADITVSALIDAYLEDRKAHIRESTYIIKCRIIEIHIRPFFGKLRLTEVTPIIVRRWQNELMQTPSYKEAPLAPSTLHNINAAASAIFNFATRYYGLAQNPFARVGSIGKLQRRLSFWTLDEFKTAYAAARDLQMRCILLLLFFGGFRIGELLALDVTDIDFQANTVSITKSFSNISGKITPPKNSSSVRKISMPPTVLALVKDYITRLQETPSPLFSYGVVSIRQRLKTIIKRTGVPPITLHGLRHSHVSYLIHSGVPIAAISRRVGHKNPKITLEIYSHMYEEDETSITAQMEKALIDWSKVGQGK